MSKRAGLLLLIIGLPLILGALASFLLQIGLRSVPLLLFKVDVGTAVFSVGAFLTALAAAAGIGARIRDRQTRKMLEGSLEESERGRIRFLRRLDHEIKNPLTGLQAALANLRESGSEPERERAVRNAGRAADRLARLLTDLRKLSDLAERPVERLPVDVPLLLEEMIEAAHSQPTYRERPIDLMITRVPRRLPPVVGDRDLLGLAVYNLIENSLKFTSAGDSVEVRALEDGRAITIEVADTGPGIAADDLQSVFEELYRGRNARGVDGSGLGLALAHRIIELHGGQISVRSQQADPSGTVFTIRLPIV